MGIDLVSVIAANGASQEAGEGLEVEVAEIITIGRSSQAETVEQGAVRSGARVRRRVAQGAIFVDVDRLATGNDDSQSERLVAASEDGGVARGTVGLDNLGTVAGGRASTNVELPHASCHGLEVDRRITAGGEDAEVAPVDRRRVGHDTRRFVVVRGDGIGSVVGGGLRGLGVGIICFPSQSTSDETCESESVLHGEVQSDCRCSETVGCRRGEIAYIEVATYLYIFRV